MATLIRQKLRLTKHFYTEQFFQKRRSEVLAGVKNTTEPCITDHHQGLPVAIKRLSVNL